MHTNLYLPSCYISVLLTLQKYTVPEEWPYEGARRLFKQPEVTEGASVEVQAINSLLHQPITLDKSLLSLPCDELPY